MERVSVVSGRKSIIGEGPHWDDRLNRLVYVDIPNGIISRLNPATKEEDIIQYDHHAVSLVLPFESDPDQMIISKDHQLCHLDWKTKETRSLCEVEVGLKTRLNDGKCDNKGRAWTGTMGLEKAPGEYRRNLGGLYSLDSAYNVKKHVSNVSISNGLAWDNSARKMYYIDSIPGKIYAFDFDEDSGMISNQKTVVDYETNAAYSKYNLPDGMTIDENKKLWVACFKGSVVLQIDPESGLILRTVTLPVAQLTSCCFGGPNYDILYVTSGYMGLDEKQISLQPDSGAVFEVRDLGAKGLPPDNFIPTK